MKRIAVLAALALVISGAALASLSVLDRPVDTLVLSSGKEVEGHYLGRTEAEIRFLVSTRQQNYAHGKVESLRSPIPHLDEFVTRLQRAGPRDVAANLEIADWCDGLGLKPEAQFARWRAIAADWDDRRAHEALEHRESRGKWQVRVGRKWLDRERFERETADWRNALELETSLMRLRANVPLSDAIESVVEWTRTYRAFFALWGDPVGLPHASEWMTVHLHGDEKSFPKSGSGGPSYFLPAESRVVVDRTRLRDTGFVRDRLGQILSSTYKNAENAQGSAPAWLAESLGIYLQAVLDGPDVLDPERILESEQDWFSAHANADSPNSLNRILICARDDLREVPGHELRMAQAYTLFDYCLNADGARHRSAFLEYARGTMAGKVSPTDFTNAVKLEGSAFEADWQAWAKSRATERETRRAARRAAGAGGGG